MSTSHAKSWVVCLCLLTLACTQSDPVALPSMPDASPIPLDAAQVLDSEPDVAVIPDAQPDIGPMDASIPEYVVEVAPDVLPDPSHYAIIGGGDETWIVWWRGGRLLGRQFSVELTRSADERTLEPIDPQEVSISSGEVVELGYSPPFEGTLRGIRAPNSADGHPGWFLIPNELGHLAFDLAFNTPDGQPPAPVQLRVGGEMTLAAMSSGAGAEDQILLMGLAPTNEGEAASAGITSLMLGADGESQPIIDPRGRPLPVSVTTSGERWVMAFSDGVCAIVGRSRSARPGEELGMWRCGTTPGSHLVGRGDLGRSKPGVFGVGLQGGQLMAWDLRPGAASIPESVNAAQAPDGASDAGIDMALDASADDASAPDASADDASATDAGVPEDAEIDGGAGQDQVEGTIVGQIALSSGQSLRVLNHLPTGVVLQVDDQPQAWLAEQRSIRRLASQDPNTLGVIVGTGNVPFRITWDLESGYPIAARDEVDREFEPPSTSPAICPGRSPETCSNDDIDCDGDSKAGICCPFVFGFDDPVVPSSDPLVGDFFVSEADVGLLFSVGYEDRVELRNIVSDSDRTTCLGCWLGGRTIRAVANYNAIVVVSADSGPAGSTACSEDCPSLDITIEGEVGSPDDSDAAVADAGTGDEQADDSPVLLWHLARNDIRRTASPCAKPHLSLRPEGEGYTAQAFCLNGLYSYRIEAGVISEPILEPYEFGEARWIGEPVKSRQDSATLTSLLVASGETFELSLIQISADGVTVIDAPEHLRDMPEEARSLPFRPGLDVGTWSARIRDGRHLDIYQPRSGWTPAVSRQWARRAYFSAHDNLAVTVANGLDENAPGFDSNAQTIHAFVHDLRVEGVFWGREFTFKESSLFEYTYHGLSVSDFSESRPQYAIWLATAGLRNPIGFKGRSVDCRPEVE